jgi:hypothetical protein
MMKKYFVLASGLFLLAVAGPLVHGVSAQAAPPVQQAAPQQAVRAGTAANGRKLFVSFGC